MKTVISKSEQHERALMVNRLRRIEGQVRGISEMIVQGRSCEDVAQQMAATRRALEKAYLHMMSCSIMDTTLVWAGRRVRKREKNTEHGAARREESAVPCGSA